MDHSDAHKMAHLSSPCVKGTGLRWPGLLLMTGLLAWVGSASAGRPLGTDDASTADAGSCQVEAWAERSRSAADGVFVVAPACGLLDGLELGGDHSWSQAGQGPARAATLGLKWVPAAWASDTGFGPLALGLKADLGYEQPAGQGWRRSGAGLLGLATLKPSDSLALHVNVGPLRSADSGRPTTHLRLALAWVPQAAVLLFAETQANDRPATTGNTFNTLGGRWWLLADVLGLDLTASREAGAGTGTGTRWSLGLGWYGIGR